ncbi:hypothetical protein [Vibrio parahaemolyticus]|uniref:hypothetical protein n=1 Tax=Vibrio parahaemolyticus TaxID=670 RepID=UPI0015DBAEA8|nr:hypothetical protein [Vibrio parahaemolyticus]
MKRFTNSIRMAVEVQDWYGALITALTLPDVCGRMVNPDLGSKARYVSWYQHWLQPLYTGRVGVDKKEHIFLHEGAGNIEDQRAKKALEDFHFITPPQNGSVHRNQINNTLQLQVDTFCLQVADAVDAWSESVSDDVEVQNRLTSLLMIHDSKDGICF